MCDAWLLVNEFPFVQVTKMGPIKTYTKVGPKHSLMALEGKKKLFFQILKLFNLTLHLKKMPDKHNLQFLQ